MGTYYTDIGTIQNAALSNAASRTADSTKIAGNLYIAAGTYDLTAAAAATETIDIVRLPKGAMVLTGLSHIILDNPGTLLTADLGYVYDSGSTETSDPDGYADALVLSSGGKVFFDANKGTAWETNIILQDPAWIRMTINSESALNSGADFSFYIVYALIN